MSAARGEPLPATGGATTRTDPAGARSRPSPRAGGGAVLAAVALAGGVAWLLLLAPGFMSDDSASQLLEARRGHLSDWHPPILAALWMVCDRVVAGPFGMLLLQTALFWTGLALLAERIAAPLAMRAIFVLVIGFAPPVLSIAGAIWKDVLLVAAMVVALGLAGRSRAFWVFALLATLARHNAIPAVAVAILLHLSAPGAPSLAALARAALATVAVFAASLGVNAALTDQRAHVEQAIAMFDIVGIGVATGTLPDFHPCFRRNGEPIDRDVVLGRYDPRSNLYLVVPETKLHFCPKPDAVSSIVGQWLGAIAAHPGAYVAHRLRVAGHLLGLHATPGSFMMTASTYTHESFPALEPPAAPSPLQERFTRVLLALRPYGVFRPWVYVVLSVVACAVAVRRRRWWPLCIALSGLAYEAGLLVVAPTEEYRYSYWMVVSALIAAAWLAIEAIASARTVRLAALACAWLAAVPATAPAETWPTDVASRAVVLSGETWRGTYAADGARLESAEGPGLPWLPGRGNALAGPVPADVPAYLESRAREFLAENRAAFALDGFTLRRDDARTRPLGAPPSQWLLAFDLLAGGLRVQDAGVRLVVSHGNLVSIALDLPPVPPPSGSTLARAATAFVPPTRVALPDGRVLDDPRWGDGAFALRFDGTGYRRVWEGLVRDGPSGEPFRVSIATGSGALLHVTPLRVPAQAMGGARLRSPLEPQTFVPLANLDVTDADGDAVTDAAGRFALAGAVSADLSGPYVRIADSCGSSVVSANAGADLDFGASASGDCDGPVPGAPGDTTAARTVAYHLNRVRDLYRALDPVTPWLDTPVDVVANGPAECVNYYDANTDTIVLNRRGGSTRCANAGENPSLLVHEWAHAYQWNQKGFFADAATREGYADVAAYLHFRTSCLFDGFFLDTDPAHGCTGNRPLDFTVLDPPVPARPDGIAAPPYSCPATGGGIAGYDGHCESAILTQAVYELAVAMQEKYGVATGMQRLLEMWIAAGPMQVNGWRVVDAGPPIAGDGCHAGSWYRTLRVANDDDGNLLDGVPDERALFDAFERHGIACGTREALPPDDTTCPALPAPASALQYDAESDAIRLAWTAVDGATGYRVSRSALGADGPFTPIANVPPEQLDFVDPDGTARAVQWYVVQALGDGSCASALGDALASTTCAAPVVLAEPFADAVVAGDTVALSWTRVENALEHDVLLGPDGEPRLLGTTDGTSLSVPSAFLEPGFSYLWQVVTRAADAACPETTSTARVVRVAGVAGAPLLTVATPAAGAGADETDVLLEGANLYLGAQVFLGGVPATLLEHDGPDRLRVRASGLASGPVEIRVVNPGGGEVRWNGFTWRAGVAGEELVANGDVETASAESGAPTPWILAGNTPPEHSCGAGPDRYVTSGVCSVRFRGERRPNGKRGRGSLVQWIALGPEPRPARLHLALAARAKNVPASARARALVEMYAAGARVESFFVRLDAGSYPFTTFAGTFTPAASYDAVAVTVLYKASSGRLWIDDVHLELVE